jgi:hypothetical protein
MIRKMNERGLSGVVVTVLLILLVLAAIVIIWAFVRPAVFGSGGKVETSLFLVGFSIPKEDVQVDDSLGKVEFKLLRNAGKAELVASNVILEDVGGDRCVKREDFPDGFKRLESKNIERDYGEGSDCEEVTELAKVHVAPIVLNKDGKELKGEIAVTYIVKGSGAVGGSGGESCGSCDDGVSCTVDSCVSGSCESSPDNNLCDDGNECTVDSCALTGCEFVNDDGVSCDGGAGICQSGICEPGVPTVGLIAHWEFEDICEDTSGGAPCTFIERVNRYDATCIHASFTSPDCPVSGETGQVGSSAHFNPPPAFAPNLDVVSISSFPNYDSSSDYTWSMWINPDTVAEEAGLFTQGETGCFENNKGHGYSIVRTISDKIGFLFYVTQFSGGEIKCDPYLGLTSADEVNDGEWSHIAVTKTGAIINFYINGNPSGTGSSATQDYSGLNKHIGTKFSTAGPNPSNNFKGKIDEVMVYNVALSEEDVMKIYMGQVGS